MNFLIITHVKHKINGENISAYGPYIREMNLWLKHVDHVTIVAPKIKANKAIIDLDYKHNNFHFNAIPAIEFTSVKNVCKALIKLPFILTAIFAACRKADHIHLRCPGNIGLLGCLVQILFPRKMKTAKYAGNWDPKAKQPISYTFQKWLLSNTFLTRNMTALVYGNWNKQTKNIKPFFTATYKNDEKETSRIRNYQDALKFVFVGSLVEGKRPLLAIKIVEKLNELGLNASLDVYGEGCLKEELQDYIVKNNLEAKVLLLGNRASKVIKDTFKEAHFLILPSKSEGWPKAIAEAMFFGTIPIATSISCIPFMLDFGKRGILIESNLDIAVNTIKEKLNNFNALATMSKNASKWSQNYTLDTFETEISKLLKL